MLIKPFNLNSIVEQVISYDRMVGQKSRNPNSFFRFACFYARAFFINAVWFIGTEPEKERLTSLPFFQKKIEISSIINLGDSSIRRFKFFLIVFLSNRILFPSRNLPVSRRPGLSGKPHQISVFFEYLREGFVFHREGTGVGTGFLNLPGVSSC